MKTVAADAPMKSEHCVQVESGRVLTPTLLPQSELCACCFERARRFDGHFGPLISARWALSFPGRAEGLVTVLICGECAWEAEQDVNKFLANLALVAKGLGTCAVVVQTRDNGEGKILTTSPRLMDVATGDYDPDDPCN